MLSAVALVVQKLSWGVPVGTVTVWVIMLSLNGSLPGPGVPSKAAAVPECVEVELTMGTGAGLPLLVNADAVQPERLPDSKPGFVRELGVVATAATGGGTNEIGLVPPKVMAALLRTMPL